MEYKHSSNNGVSALDGLHIDLEMVRSYLIQYEGYLPHNITIMQDKGPKGLLFPDRPNIVSQLLVLVRLHYSKMSPVTPVRPARRRCPERRP